MSKVVAIMSMSLDGFVADDNDGVEEVFDWYFNSGTVEINTGGSDPMTFKVSPPSAGYIRGLTAEIGAMLTGRRTFDVARGWNGNHGWGPAFVLTHKIPEGWPRPDSTVHFVTDGIESAVRQAKAAARGKSVGVHGADTIQQLLNAGLLDEICVDVAAVLLGSGIRLFDRLDHSPSILGNPRVIEGVGVTAPPLSGTNDVASADADRSYGRCTSRRRRARMPGIAPASLTSKLPESTASMASSAAWTTTGSNWLPECRCSSARASALETGGL